MKFLYGMLTGALAVSGAVVWTRSDAGWMFLLGAVLGSILAVVIARRAQRAHEPKLVTVTAAEKSANLKTSTRAYNRRKPDKPMLPTLQQDVLSALMHLGVPFREAEKAVRTVASEKSGESFDQLFRRAVAVLKPQSKTYEAVT